jgi:5'-nucleotidase
MNILITNDDGINAPALLKLARWAKKLGHVTVVAPKYEQSGKSHSIEIFKAFEFKKVLEEEGLEVYCLDSTPADCVRFSFLGLKKDFDLVISGINKGFNVGRDINYSGTAGAMFEGANLGALAVAFSTDPSSMDYAVSKLDDVWNYIMSNKLLEQNKIYNVNIPSGGEKILITCQGGRYYCDRYIEQENNMFLPSGYCIYKDEGKIENDAEAVMNGYISISPMTLDRTNREVYNKLLYLNN